MKGTGRIIGLAILIGLAGCAWWDKPEVEHPPQKWDVGPDTYFEGPDWIPHEQKTLGRGELDMDTWLISGVDPEHTGVNSQAARFKRHWLNQMFMDPESVRAIAYPPAR